LIAGLLVVMQDRGGIHGGLPLGMSKARVGREVSFRW